MSPTAGQPHLYRLYAPLTAAACEEVQLSQQQQAPDEGMATGAAAGRAIKPADAAAADRMCVQPLTCNNSVSGFDEGWGQHRSRGQDMLLLFRWLPHRHKASICHLGCFTEDKRAALAPEPSSVLLLGYAMSWRQPVCLPGLLGGHCQHTGRGLPRLAGEKAVQASWSFTCCPHRWCIKQGTCTCGHDETLEQVPVLGYRCRFWQTTSICRPGQRCEGFMFIRYLPKACMKDTGKNNEQDLLSQLM